MNSFTLAYFAHVSLASCKQSTTQPPGTKVHSESFEIGECTVSAFEDTKSNFGARKNLPTKKFFKGIPLESTESWKSRLGEETSQMTFLSDL